MPDQETVDEAAVEALAEVFDHNFCLVDPDTVPDLDENDYAALSHTEARKYARSALAAIDRGDVPGYGPSPAAGSGDRQDLEDDVRDEVGVFLDDVDSARLVEHLWRQGWRRQVPAGSRVVSEGQGLVDGEVVRVIAGDYISGALRDRRARIQPVEPQP